MKRKGWSFALLFVACALGCELSPPSQAPVRVLGTVTWHGQPVRRGSIVFAADPDRNDHQDLAVGVLHYDGSYELTTAEGLPPRPGWYRVTLMGDEPPLPARYADPTLSGLSTPIVGPGPLRLDWELP